MNKTFVFKASLSWAPDLNGGASYLLSKLKGNDFELSLLGGFKNSGFACQRNNIDCASSLNNSGKNN